MSDTNLSPTAAEGASTSPTPSPTRRGGHRTAVLLGLLGLAAGALGGWRSTAPLYRCEAIVYIAPSVPTPQDPAGINVLPMFSGFVAFQVQLMESLAATHLAMETSSWQRTGEGTSPSAIDRFIERRDIVHRPDTQHIQVRFVDSSPDVALAGVRALLGAYEKLSNEVNSKDDRLTFALTQAEVLTATLKDVDDEIVKLTAEFGGVEAVEMRHRASVEQLLATEADLDQIRSALRDESRAAGGSKTGSAELVAREAAGTARLASLAEQSRTLGIVRTDAGALRVKRDDLGRRLAQMKELKEQLTLQLVGKGRITIADQGGLPNSPFQDRRPRRAAVGAALGALPGILVAMWGGLRRRRRLDR